MRPRAPGRGRAPALVAAAWLGASACAVGPDASPGEPPPDLVMPGAELVADPAAVRCLGAPDGWGERDELEPHAAANPADPEHIVAAWMTRVAGERGAILASASRDAGRSWEPPRILPFNDCAGGPPGARATSDPWVSFGPEGRVYVSAIGWTPAEDFDSVSVVGVVTSVDGGSTWGDLVRVSESRSPEFMHDNTAVAADPFQPDVAWISTTYWGPEGRPVAVSRTSDGGRTWSPLQLATAAAWGTPAHGAPQPVVTREATYVFFGDGPGGARPSVIRRERRDAGRWSDPSAIHDGAAIEEAVRFPGTREEIQIAEDILHAAADSVTGDLYVVFTSASDDDPTRPAVRIAGSRDGGASWSPAIAVGDRGEAAWRPSLAVLPGGPAVVTYFRVARRSGDPAEAAAPGRLDTEVGLQPFAWGTRGLEPGPPRTIDRFQWRPRENGSRFLGDYHGLVAAGRTVVAIYARSTPDGVRVVAARMPWPASGTMEP